MSKKCARCGKPATTRAMWETGPRGNRTYDLCDKCAKEVEKK